MAFLGALFDWLTESQAGWDQFFHDWIGGGASAARAAASPQAALYAQPAFAELRAGLDARASALPTHPYFERPRPVSLLIEDVEALWAPIAERDDWSLFEAKLAEIEGTHTHGAGSAKLPQTLA